MSEDRRTFMKAAGVTALTGVAGCTGGGDSGGDGSNEDGSDGSAGSGSDGDSESTEAQTLQTGLTSNFAGGDWVTAFLEATEMYAADQGFEYQFFGTEDSANQEIENVNTMTNQGYDGILAKPFDAEAINSAIESAKEAGVPTFTIDMDATTDDVAMYTAFSNEAAAETSAETLIERTRESNPDADSYRVLNILGTQGTQIADQRDQPFTDLIEAQADFEMVGRLRGRFRTQDARERTEEWINGNEVPDAIYTANSAMALGVLSALETLDLAHPRGHDDHITLVTLDAGPQIIENINDDLVDAAIDQPNYFYGPIAIEYMKRYIEGDGEAELPDVGETITEDDLTIESADHEVNGETVELWADPIWAPAEIVEKDGHRHFKTNSITITKENANEDYHWGNLWGSE